MSELAKIDSFRKEIAIAETIEEVKMLSTKGELLAEMAKKLNITTKGQNDLGRTRVMLEERKRELIESMFPKGGDRKSKSKITTLKDVGITRDESSDAKIIKEEKPLVEVVMDEIEQKNEVITPKFVAAKVRQKKREIQRKTEFKEKQLPEDVFNVIYCDPPWEYRNSGFAMSAENQYPTMPTHKICELPIPKLANNNCILFMWVTNPLIEDAFKVLRAWGFEYKTNLVWVKERHTAGFYVFGQHELLLIATKGSFLPSGEKPKSIIYGENKIHSRKPHLVYEIIEKMYPDCKYVELFARNTRYGWQSWGNQV